MFTARARKNTRIRPVFAAAAIADAAAAIDRDLGIGFLRFTFETTVSVIVSA